MFVIIIEKFELIDVFLLFNKLKGYFFKGIWKMAKIWLNKKTAKKFIIESKKGSKTLLKVIGDTKIIPLFLGGECEIDLLENPGAGHIDMMTAFRDGEVVNKNVKFLKKYFWDVDLSKPGNEFGVKTDQEEDLQDKIHFENVKELTNENQERDIRNLNVNKKM